MKPVKLSKKSRYPGQAKVYYTIAIPREIGDQFHEGAWFLPSVEKKKIVLKQIT